MKRCPQCGAEYDDHDQYCFVDGAELAAVVAAAAPAPLPVAPPIASSPAPRPSPAPASSRSSRPLPDPGQRETPGGRGLPLWAMAGMMGLLFVAFAFVGLAGMMLLVASPQGSPPPPPVASAPRAPAPLTPLPTTPAATTWVQFESEPSGATVFEEDKELCTTPCRVPHPEYAPPTRTFVLRAAGFLDTEYSMSDPTQIQLVKLASTARPPSTRRPKGGGEEILNER